MNLYLLRHGVAVEFGTAGYTDDSERPLTVKGERKVGDIAKAMVALELDFDRILSSPFQRARQTAEIVAAALQAGKRLEFSTALVPGAPPRELIESLLQLDPVPENLLLVGHEPNLSQVISWLVSGEPGLSITLKKGGLCKLAIEELKPRRCASLEWLLTPKQMARMA